MRFFANLQNIEKKYPLTCLGLVLAPILAILSSIYAPYFWDRNPQVKYTVNSILGVYDVREEVGKLDIIYDGINIREKKQMLSLISLNVSNVGHKHLTKALYDKNDPLGFSLNGAMLLKAEIIEASNSYFFKNLSISLESKKMAHFSPVIIDSGEWFSVKILALHNENESPQILPLGKIAGVKEIELIPWSKEAYKTPFWKEVIRGDIFIHLTRAVCYFLALILIGIIIGSLIGKLSAVASKRKRKRHLHDFMKLSDISFKQEDDFIFETYINRGEMYLVRVTNLLSSKKALENAINTYSEYMEKEDFDAIIETELRNDYPISPYPFVLLALIPKLLDSGFVRKEQGEIIMDSHMRNTLRAFLLFLRGRGVNLYMPNVDSYFSLADIP